MTKFQVFVSEQDVMKMVLEFLENRKLHISQLSVERETGIINGEYSEDGLFFRQLILDGQWDSALDFAEPLHSYPCFNSRHFRYLILKHKYFELLCIKTEPGPLQNNAFTVDEIVECLHSLESVCPSSDDYRQLRALLTLPTLSEHDQFRHWNPSSARIECFNAVYPLVRDFLSSSDPTHSESRHSSSSTNERLLQLVIKGMLYEAAVDYCQNKALVMSDNAKQHQQVSFRLNKLLYDRNNNSQVDGVMAAVESTAADLSLVCWLESLPTDAFGVQFVQKSLDLKCEPMPRPKLEAVWTEQILVTPIKPQMFPHSAVPTGRLKSAEKMSLSMIPQYDGLSSGLGTIGSPSVMSRPGGRQGHRDSLLSQSVAVGFQLTGKNLMQQSAIDVLFDTSAQTQNTAGNTAVAAGGHLPGAVGQSESYSTVSNPQLQQLQQQQQSVYFPHQYQPNQLEVIEELAALCPQNAASNEMISYQSPPVPPLTARQQLDEIRRRSVSPQVAASTKVDGSSMEDVTQPIRHSGGRLYQEFNSKQQRMGRCSSEPPAAMSQGGVTYNGPMDGLTYQMMQMSFHSQQPTMDQERQFQLYANQKQAMISSSMAQAPSGLNAMMKATPMVPAGSSGLDNTQRRQPVSKASQNGAEIIEEGGLVSYKSGMGNNNNKHVQFVAVNRLEDQQAIRAVAFHPSGRYFAVGTNSRQLHVCRYPEVKLLKSDHITKQPETLLLRPKQHRGSIYCVSYNPTGELLATGSNDKAIRLMKFDAETCKIGPEFELTMHDGTVRDLVFMEDTSNRTSLLISGGAGNCRIHLTDCATAMPLRQLYGHTAPVLGLYTWGGCMFVSCSQDKTIRFWDLRCADSVNMIAPSKATSSSPVTSICVDPGGRLLASGHEDASIMLYDIRGSHVVQLYRPHVDEVRTVRFSPGTYYLLSGSYDKKVVITDIRGNLFEPLKYLPVTEHDDKVIQCRWHPHDFTFLSTSADRSVVLWALPPPDTE